MERLERIPHSIPRIPYTGTGTENIPPTIPPEFRRNRSGNNSIPFTLRDLVELETGKRSDAV